MSAKLTDRQVELLRYLEECGGEAEVFTDDWKAYHELQALGLITLGGARGPDRAWKRAELVMVPLYRYADAR